MPDPHELIPEPVAPDLPGTVVVRPTADEAIDALCADLYLQAQGCVQAFGDFHLAVDPTDAGESVLVRLMVDPLYRDLPWASTHVWPAREGPHPPHDGRSGYRRLSEVLGEHAGLPPGQLHPIGVGEARADELYEAELRRVLSRRERGHDRLDFALLSAPGVPMVVGEGLAAASGGAVGLTAGALNACRCLAVLAVGAGGRFDAGGVSPLAGELRWYLDHAACAPGGGA